MYFRHSHFASRDFDGEVGDVSRNSKYLDWKVSISAILLTMVVVGGLATISWHLSYHPKPHTLADMGDTCPPFNLRSSSLISASAAPSSDMVAIDSPLCSSPVQSSHIVFSRVGSSKAEIGPSLPECQICSITYQPSFGYVIFDTYYSISAGVQLVTDSWRLDGKNLEPLVLPGTLSGIIDPSVTYDPRVGAVILFGGSNGKGVLADTWELKGGVWTKIPVAHSPPPRFGGTFACDASGNVCDLFGGESCGISYYWASLELQGNKASNIFGSCITLQDTWIWNNVDWHQVKMVESPSARLDGSAVAFGIDRTLLFGGTGSADFQSTELWEFDGTTNLWTRLAVGSLQLPRGTERLVTTGNTVYGCRINGSERCFIIVRQ